MRSRHAHGCGIRSPTWRLKCSVRLRFGLNFMPKSRSLVVCFSLIVACSPARKPASADAVDRPVQRELVDAISSRLQSVYVSAAAAGSARSRLSARLDAGAYDNLDRRALANALTLDLQSVTHDKHVRVSSAVEPPPALDDRHTKVFGRIERVRAVAYVEVLSFGVPPEKAGAEVANVMSSIADARAVVFDLRSNGGGHPGTVALLASYLFGEEPVRLNTMFDRASGTLEESFTDPRVKGSKLGPDKPAFVLIGPRTFSGAEEFSYDLQALRRVIVVGESSGGGAHAGGFEPLPAGFSAFIPARRPINPVTKTNWEGVGVTPDIRVPSKRARAVALELASKSVRSSPTR
jgi:hypothetical protein